MKATFALLPDWDTQNLITALAWRLHLKHRTGLGVRRLPPHISLKQPFEIDDLGLLEEYASYLAASLSPLSLRLGGIQVFEGGPLPVLSFAVEDSERLRHLHARLNRDLAERFGERQGDFDGDAYQFHLTVAAGGAPAEVYHTIIAEFDQIAEVDGVVGLGVLALFTYDFDEVRQEWEYMTYKVLPLRARA